jgi:zinc finger protein
MSTELKNQPCPVCSEKKLTLREEAIEIPHFGRTYVFSMTCEGCAYRKADLEAGEHKEACKYTFEISSDKDLNIKIVKSGEATVKIPYIMTIEPGPTSEGFITNVEGLLNRVKTVLESTEQAEEDKDSKKKVRKMIKKLNNVVLGREKLKITIEDPTGNSAILSDKAVKKKL